MSMHVYEESDVSVCVYRRDPVCVCMCVSVCVYVCVCRRDPVSVYVGESQ